MANPEVTNKIEDALEEIAGAQSSLINATETLKEALELLNGDEGEVDPPDPPKPGEYFGGPPGSGGRKVIEGKTYGQVDMEQFENTDLLDCTFTKALYDVTLPKHLRLLSCTFKNITAPDDRNYVLYINNGHKETQLNFIMDQCLITGCKAKTFAEFKASELYIVNCTQDDSSQIPQTIRQRHGRMLMVRNCKGFKEISTRGWAHYIKACPGASIVWWAGNLPARNSQWDPMHIAGGGGNMQCSELCYAEGVGPIMAGKESLKNKPDPYKALNCIVGPNTGKVTLGMEEGTDYEELNSYIDLWSRCGLKPTGPEA
jgi:hypothetical protein